MKYLNQPISNSALAAKFVLNCPSADFAYPQALICSEKMGLVVIAYGSDMASDIST
jgi:hypothetical protein